MAELTDDERDLQAERDKLAGEVEALKQIVGGPLSYTAMRAAKEAAEAKLTALVEALGDAKTLFNQIALERRKLGPLATQAQQMAHRLAALAHHSAPVDPQPGEIRVIGGVRQRFIEHGDVGQVWEPLSTTPTSAPVEDGEDVALHEWLDEQGASRGEDNGDGFAPYSLLGRVRDLFDRSNPPQEERSDPLGLVAGDDNRPIPMLLFCPKCGVQHVDAPDFIPDPGGGDLGVAMTVAGDRAVAWTNPPHKSHLCHACGCIWRPADVPTEGVASITTKGKADNWSGDDNHKALVEAARAVLNGDGRDFGLPRELSGNLRSALAAFQSRQEEK